MEENPPLKKSPGAGQVVTAAALILFGWCTGYAATINIADCDALSHKADSAANMHRNDAAKLRPIDLVAIQDSAANIDSLNSADPIDNVAATPFLYLTPRVASALREIFDSPENEATKSNEEGVISSPVAGTEDGAESMELLEDSTITESIDEEFDRMILQRQMFRTDI